MNSVDESTLPLWAATPEKQPDCWTVRSVFNEYRRPEAESMKSSKAIARRVDLWEQFTGDLPVDQVSIWKLRDFQSWLEQLYPLPTGGSSINKAVDEIRLILRIAKEVGLPVGHFWPPRKHKVTTRPKYNLSDEQVDRLLVACNQMDWPPKHSYRSFKGTGVDASLFWQAVIVLLRNYGMRVQDLVAYSSGKSPLLWQDVTFDEASPNLSSEERWPYGWLKYKASKTEKSSGRVYVLPLTQSVRGVLDRLRAAAVARHGAVIAKRPVLPCPMGRSFLSNWKKLQVLADVHTRTGELYQLEDFRKTVGTVSVTVHPDLPYALCGWSRSGGIADRHYITYEQLLVKEVSRMPLPKSFKELECNAQHTAA